ncbi:hypothetical protein P152DRAFT_390820 [Eremomyces bilateralis CBS 781.70]|uniref:CWH43-like N-terminal domain-containing protein n=1 Tax=Eremomyces bilateralis CBS 781.70 TaxID=1392243 RepID=A0A6G1GC84_9PEZI|nr:uncharacterized protein P152DRAFT_390820 [Eremomyces bilateralis CBS 781.70]KAF1815510.1 hypothetical protein P152DRAFT_390820 [Eremomyces bilateralis CBS 781.70]
MWGISYWFLPLFSSLVWLAMLLGLLLVWVRDGKPIYETMEHGQRIAYISDVGATDIKPLFIAMAAVSVVSFDIALIAERWLRHSGRLKRNTSLWQKLWSNLCILFAIVGAAGIILLSIFDTFHHHRLHQIFLGLFIAGYVVSAIFACVEYQRLGTHYAHLSILRISFWLKLFFIVTEVALAIAFGALQRVDNWNAAAVLEWVIALIFTFYLLSFFVDFIPAMHTKHHQSRETSIAMAEAGEGRNGQANGYAKGDQGRFTYGNKKSKGRRWFGRR